MTIISPLFYGEQMLIYGYDVLCARFTHFHVTIVKYGFGEILKLICQAILNTPKLLNTQRRFFYFSFDENNLMNQ